MLIITNTLFKQQSVNVKDTAICKWSFKKTIISICKDEEGEESHAGRTVNLLEKRAVIQSDVLVEKQEMVGHFDSTITER